MLSIQGMPANNMNEIDQETIEFYVKEIHRALKEKYGLVYSEYGKNFEKINEFEVNDPPIKYETEITFFPENSLEEMVKEAIEFGKSKVKISGFKGKRTDIFPAV